jgi:hypothetical protein
MGWSERYKNEINCDNPKGFSQRAHCQGRKTKMKEEKEQDHEVSMAQTQLKKSEENIRKLRKALGKKERNIPAWVQAKITDTEHNTDAASSYMDEATDGIKARDYKGRLDKWFEDGGWVQTGGKYDGKPCAKQPGQTTKPFCRDPDDRAAMSKDERERRAKKKRREDPNPNRTGEAKIVSEQVITGPGTPYKNPDDALKKLIPKGEKVSPTKKVSTNVISASHSNWRQELQLDEEKDACYKKVKSRYKIWPSAYASGALVRCRKVGASNWGNKSESYEFSNWRDEFSPTEFESVNIIEPQPLQPSKGIGSKLLDLDEAGKKCWKGYEKKGTQTLFGKTYNRCVKAEGYFNWRKELLEQPSAFGPQSGGWKIGAPVGQHLAKPSKPKQKPPIFGVDKTGLKGPEKPFEQYVDWRFELIEAKKSEMACNKPKAEAHGSGETGKSHVVKACENGKEKLIRFGQLGVKGSPKKEGESEEYASRRRRFKTRHAKNIAKGKMSAAYWSNRVKW